ncbi:MAG TPA: LysM peptidoglycan-binding domain-containing protein, partial [Verrucomicrobiota bacterium]|nr:LysM peptidoglycan-binding domain-containing protein [Verrucomicrobiota bacterium]
MSNPNPLVPQGSLLEEQARSKSTFQMAAFIVALHVVVLGGFLFLGCKKEEETPHTTAVDTFAAPPPVFTAPTNAYSATDPFATPTNAAPPPVSNPVFTPTPPVSPVVESPAPITTPLPSATTEHLVKKGDLAYAIAKKHGVTLKQLQEANPGKDLAKIKVGEKLQVPAPSTLSSPQAPAGITADSSTYTVKGGDNLSRLAKKFGTTVKAIREANGMTSNDIKVGQKLKIPGKGTPAPESSTSVPASTPIPA